MALRVLLADESSTIKKVFQLALQDFAVDVKPVNVGLDVSAVAESFKPDIIFADVLLQKKNGYDVSLEIKQNNSLNSTPVVLMWSGFMDLDEDKMQASGADAQLEKPFDVKSLRALVESLVPKTKDQNLSSYLSFPKLPDFEESGKNPQNQAKDSEESELPPMPPQSQHQNWNMESFEPPQVDSMTDDFQELNLKPEIDNEESLIPPGMDIDKELLSQEEEEDSSWQQKSLGKYKVQSDEDFDNEDSLPNVHYVVPDEGPLIADDELEVELSPEEENANLSQPSRPSHPVEFSFDDSSSLSADKILANLSAQISEEMLAQIVREQCQKQIEDAVWKILPDLARQIVEKEVQRLVDDDEVELS